MALKLTVLDIAHFMFISTLVYIKIYLRIYESLIIGNR